MIMTRFPIAALALASVTALADPSPRVLYDDVANQYFPLPDAISSSAPASAASGSNSGAAPGLLEQRER
jgi:hypothetical protein